MSHRAIEARFEAWTAHRSLIVRWLPKVAPRARVVFVPAFGDEMNQTRRMVKLAAEALAARDIASLAFDLLGTGDSSADFSEATVAAWLQDCREAFARAQAEAEAQAEAAAPLVVIACRLGAALAVEASRSLERPAAALIGWAPLLQGRSQLSGMLRADKLSRPTRADGAALEPKSAWASGRHAVLGGYPVSPQLAEQLSALDAAGAPNAARAVLFEVRVPVTGMPIEPSPALRERASSWAEQGVPTHVAAIAGPGFWNVADLVDVPALIDATVEAVETTLEGASR